MGMSIHIAGFTPPTDPQYNKMLSVYKACTEANVAIPNEVQEFFNHEAPHKEGLKVDFSDYRISNSTKHAYNFVKKYVDENEEGYDVNIEELLEHFPNIRIIRFYCSY